jgi:hypothetical protein
MGALDARQIDRQLFDLVLPIKRDDDAGRTDGTAQLEAL